MLFRFLLIFLGVLVVYRAVRRLLLPDRGRDTVRGAEREVIHKGEMHRDPVCGTYVPREGSIRLHQGGREYYFCSPEGHDEFRRGAGAASGSGEGGR